MTKNSKTVSKALAAINLGNKKKKKSKAKKKRPSKLTGHGDFVEPSPLGVSKALERLES